MSSDTLFLVHLFLQHNPKHPLLQKAHINNIKKQPNPINIYIGYERRDVGSDVGAVADVGADVAMLGSSLICSKTNTFVERYEDFEEVVVVVLVLVLVLVLVVSDVVVSLELTSSLRTFTERPFDITTNSININTFENILQ